MADRRIMRLRLRRRDGSEVVIDVTKTVRFNDPGGTAEYGLALDRLKNGGHRLGFSSALLDSAGDFVALEVVDDG